MALDAIKKVTEAEELAAKMKADAVQSAKKALEDAERSGEEKLRTARAGYENEAKMLVFNAEALAKEEANRIHWKTIEACDTLREEAGKRLDAAADLIVGRVMGG